MWDVRARAAVCEFATGNNAVQSLAWDSKRNCLYAATECNYMDRHGYRHGYRRAKIPRGGNDDDDDDDDFEERCWPSEAWHGEDYYEYAYDAGEHTLCECIELGTDDLLMKYWICSPFCVQRDPRYVKDPGIRGRWAERGLVNVVVVLRFETNNFLGCKHDFVD